MDRNEALAILGVSPTATPTEIKEAHEALTGSVTGASASSDLRTRSEAAERQRRIEEAYRALLAERRRYADQVHERETVPRLLGGAAPARRQPRQAAAPGTAARGVEGRFPLGRALMVVAAVASVAVYLARGRGSGTTVVPLDSASAPVPEASHATPAATQPAPPAAPAPVPPVRPAASVAGGSPGAAAPVPPVSLAGLSQGERMAAEAACASAAGGEPEYNTCLSGQLEDLRAAPKRPDLSRLSAAERDSLTAACASVRQHDGLAAYRRCLVDQAATFAPAVSAVDLSTLTEAERAVVDSACQHARSSDGSAGFDRCAAERVAALRRQ